MTVFRGDALPSLRQLAGLPAGGRLQSGGGGGRRGGGGRGRRGHHVGGAGQRRRFAAVPSAAAVEARPFGVVVLDPPTFAASRFGAVDIVRDYQVN